MVPFRIARIINLIKGYVTHANLLELVGARVAASVALSPPSAVDVNYTKKGNPEVILFA